MPRFTFDSTGSFTNGTNLTAAANTATSYLVHNYSGSAIDVEFRIGANGDASLTRASGLVIDLPVGSTTVKFDSDEVCDVTINAGTSAVQWRVGAGQSVHGLAAKRGTGHTSSHTTINPHIAVATI